MPDEKEKKEQVGGPVPEPKKAPSEPEKKGSMGETAGQS